MFQSKIWFSRKNIGRNLVGGAIAKRFHSSALSQLGRGFYVN